MYQSNLSRFPHKQNRACVEHPLIPMDLARIRPSRYYGWLEIRSYRRFFFIRGEAQGKEPQGQDALALALGFQGGYPGFEQIGKGDHADQSRNAELKSRDGGGRRARPGGDRPRESA